MIVLVISTGRAGSSAVARILHTKLSVSMGKNFRKPDEENPKGFYEDLDFRNINEAFMRGTLTYPEFDTRLENLIKQKKSDWGIKDPRLSELWGLYLKHLPDAKIIITSRNKSAVIDSCVKCYGWTEPNAKRFVENRLKAMEYLKEYPVIDFDEQLSDNYIENFLKENLWN